MALDGFLEGAQSIMDAAIRNIRNSGTTDVMTGSINRLTALKVNIERMCTRFPQCRPLVEEVNQALEIFTDLKR